MKKYFIILLLSSIFLLKLTPYAQSKFGTDTSLKPRATSVISGKVDTVKPILIEENKQKNSPASNNMPWITALTIGIISTGANILISYMLRKSNERNLVNQLEANKVISKFQTKSTLHTKNRQDWLNELRHMISELISLAATMVLEMNSPNKNAARIKELIQKLIYAEAKIRLMLNDNKPEQMAVLEKVKIVVMDCVKNDESFDPKQFEVKMNDLVIVSRVLFDLHWKKIKNID